MKKLFIAILALLCTLSLGAQEIRSLDIGVWIHPDGSAHIAQEWDVNVVRGTEWYIPIGNLGKMEIYGLEVNENGFEFESDGRNWDSSRSLEEKTGRCGIIDKGDGVELCWGQGAYGDHKWRVDYEVSGLVQSLKDYDAFNFMFVNPDMIAGPQSVSVVIHNETGGEEWTSENVKVWGFGTNGDVYVTDGEVICSVEEPMSRSEKVILMVRFDKGLMTPALSRNIKFSKMERKAKKGSDYDSEEAPEGFILLLIGGALFALWYAFQKMTGRTLSKKIYGKHKVEGWYRDIPEDGDLFASYYILDCGERFGSGSHDRDLVGSVFLKWVLEGKSVPEQNPAKPKRLNLRLFPEKLEEMKDGPEKELYRMALKASGANNVLEDKEFERWSENHYEQIFDWPSTVKADGKSTLMKKGLVNIYNISSAEGKVKACQVQQFKNFLKDFTISGERGVGEVVLWRDYLIFAQLYGIADKVASQLKKLYPGDFEKFAGGYNMSSETFTDIIRLNHMMSSISYNAAHHAHAQAQAQRSSGGGGGMSFGGGGGFSGGGSGGGSR